MGKRKKAKGLNGKSREARLYKLAIVSAIIQLLNNLIELALKFSKD